MEYLSGSRGSQNFSNIQVSAAKISAFVANFIAIFAKFPVGVPFDDENNLIIVDRALAFKWVHSFS